MTSGVGTIGYVGSSHLWIFWRQLINNWKSIKGSTMYLTSCGINIEQSSSTYNNAKVKDFVMHTNQYMWSSFLSLCEFITS